MIHIYILLALTAWLLVGHAQTETNSFGILKPNSIYRGVDGIGIDTKFAVVEGEPKVTISRVTDISSFPPLSVNPNVKAVTPYYEISTPEFIFDGGNDKYFLIRVPLPAGVPTDNLAAFTLADNADVESFPPSENETQQGYTWFSEGATYVPGTNEVIFYVEDLGPKPLRFVIASGKYAPKSSNNNQNLQTLSADELTFTARCAANFPGPDGETCGQKEIDDAASMMKEFYKTYIDDLGFPGTTLKRETNPDGSLGAYVIEIQPRSQHESCTTTTAIGCAKEEKTWISIKTDGITNEVKEIIRHEMFHTLQRYLFNEMWAELSKNPNYIGQNPTLYNEPRKWFIEGLAELAASSGATVNLRTGRSIRPLDVSLYSTDSDYEYRMQDFWEFVSREGRKTDSASGMAFFKNLYDSDPSKAGFQPYYDGANPLAPWDPKSVDQALKAQTQFTRGGLKESYYLYVRDKLGGRSGSGGGYVGTNPICSTCSFDPSLFDPNVAYQEISLNTKGGATIDATLDPLSTKVYRIPLAPGQTLQDIADRLTLNDPSGNLKYFLFEQDGYVYIVVVNTDFTPNATSSSGQISLADAFEPADNGAFANGWGEPHLRTPDGFEYDFQAKGDYVVAYSTEPDDTFMVQTRYKGFTTNGHDWSSDTAIAMQVGSDVIEVYGVNDGSSRIFLNGQEIPNTDYQYVGEGNFSFKELPGGGAIELRPWSTMRTLTIKWPAPDETFVWVRGSGSGEIRGLTTIYYPKERFGKVSGVFGNFDGNPSNDLQLQDGTRVVNTFYDIHYGGFRDDWSVSQGGWESLFSQGADLYDPTFPKSEIKLEDFPQSVLDSAGQTCRNAGAVDAFVLRSCIIDVATTGDPKWAELAALVDPANPQITVNPSATTLGVNKSLEIGAIVFGDVGNGISWTATGGTVVPASNGRTATYTAPSQSGTYTVTARLTEKPEVTASAVVTVSSNQEGNLLLISKESNGGNGGSISANGQLISYTRLDSQGGFGSFSATNFIKNLQTGTLQTLNSGQVGSTRLSADGTHLYYQETSGPYYNSRNTLYSLNPATGASVQVSSGGIVLNVVGFSSSHNSRFAVISDLSSVYLQDSDTGIVEPIVTTSSSTSDEGRARSNAVSNDGRYVAISTTKPDLITGDTNNVSDVFLKDRQTGQIARVSVNANGEQANGYSSVEDISADGRYLLLWSLATNLVPNDTNNVGDLFLKDVLTGSVTLVSVTQTGMPGNAWSGRAKISSDGRFIVFESIASNLVSSDLNQLRDIFLRDTVSNTTLRISARADGSQTLSDNYSPSITPDGTYVIFTAYDNLVSSDRNGKADVYRIVNPLK